MPKNIAKASPYIGEKSVIMAIYPKPAPATIMITPISTFANIICSFTSTVDRGCITA